MFRVLIAIFVLALAATSCFAGKLPTDIDTDKDGFISLKEAEKVPDLKEQFQALDVNKDGKLDKAELTLLVQK